MIKAKLADIPVFNNGKKVFIYGNTDDFHISVEIEIENNHDLKKLIDWLVAILNSR